jgi:hypothetical protein
MNMIHMVIEFTRRGRENKETGLPENVISNLNDYITGLKYNSKYT